MSKWILIEVENNDILEPTTYDTYEDAYEEMVFQFNLIKGADMDANIHKDYVSVQSDYNSWDWRIYEVKY
ncbi:MAG: hypothetical protein UH850_14755 [Paludibacteraceae bacterium]|nr:hypothetical protein [Paludibacteraceae bacterium]